VHAAVTLPRPVYPDTTSMITRRCTQRQFLLTPCPKTNNAFIYCLTVAAQRFGIDVIDFIQMSNHLHDAIYDTLGNAPLFYEHFHKLLAKCINAQLGRWENFFSSEQTCVVRLETEDDLVRKLIYIATNPVKDGLVERVDDWPGASGYRALQNGTTLRATRPKDFFSDDGDMPDEVTLELKIPSKFDRARVLQRVKEGVEEFEIAEDARRAKEGLRVRGAYAIRRQSWRESPTSREPRRNRHPTFTARSAWALAEALQRRYAFLDAYEVAREALVAGLPATFPFGTYWLKRFASVAVSQPEKLN